jgi:hypothetical protein
VVKAVLAGAAVVVVLAYVADLLSRGMVAAEIGRAVHEHPLPAPMVSSVIAAANRITREAAASRPRAEG